MKRRLVLASGIVGIGYRDFWHTIVMRRERPAWLVFQHRKLLHRFVRCEALKFSGTVLDTIDDCIAICKPCRLGFALGRINISVLVFGVFVEILHDRGLILRLATKKSYVSLQNDMLGIERKKAELLRQGLEMLRLVRRHEVLNIHHDGIVGQEFRLHAQVRAGVVLPRTGPAPSGRVRNWLFQRL